jgi:thioredoxin reductase (NADPH)
MGGEHHYDLVILGGGPAGMTASIYAARANLTTIILESNITGGQVNSTYTVENFPSYHSIHGMELMEKMRSHVDSLNIKVEEVCEIERIELNSSIKSVVTDAGTFTCKAIILATGRKPIPLETPTTCDQVHWCAICDGMAYVGKRVLVVGGGNSAFDESLYMLSIGIAHITLVEVMPRYFAAQATQEKLFGCNMAIGYTSTRVADLIVENNCLKGAILEHLENNARTTIAVEGVFVFLGQHPNNELFKSQMELTAQGYIKTRPDMSTEIPGVFSAGDINEKPFRQITTAISDGTIAALAAERYIRSQRNVCSK